MLPDLLPSRRKPSFMGEVKAALVWEPYGGELRCRTMFVPEAIVQDQVTGLFGFRLELGRDDSGIRRQARRTGFVKEKAALAEYERLCQQRDALHPQPRLSDPVRDICQGWVLARQ